MTSTANVQSEDLDLDKDLRKSANHVDCSIEVQAGKPDAGTLSVAVLIHETDLAKLKTK